MENTILPLTGVARAKYMRDFTRMINNSDNFADIFTSKSKSKKSIGVKKKRKIESKVSVRLQKKDINQDYVVQRMKFLKQTIDIVNQTVNKTQPTRTRAKPIIGFSKTKSKFEEFKNKSFEIERQKLAQMYKVQLSNLTTSMEPANQPKTPDEPKSPIPEPHRDNPEPEPIKNLPSPCIAHSLINNPIILQDLEQGDDCGSEQPKVEFQKSTESENIQNGELISIEPSDQPIQDNSQDKAIQLCQNQLQNINLNSNHCNALLPSNTMTTSRRICHRTKRFKRHSMKPFCAHCHDLITEVAYFSGTQQLCFECADRHYERVSRARYRDRPMGYKEFKNIGGDTIYNKN